MDPAMMQPRAVMRFRDFRIVLLAALSLASASALAQTFAPSQENPEDYPDGTGREPTFYACTPCHGFKIVAQQGQSRRQWEDTLDWMTKRHGMPPIDGDLRKIVLDYLETTYPPRQAPGGWQNPFVGK
jgi:hypothetical protein